MHSPLFVLNTARTAALILASLVVATSASAMSLRELRGLAMSGKQGPNFVNYYLVGVMEGAIEAHAQAVRHGSQPTMCLTGRRPEPSVAKALYDSELNRNADVYEADMAVQLVMINALTAAYRC